jgi:alanine-synthesizing transaminase
MIAKIVPAVRTDNITYAVRDIVVLANQVAKTGKEMLYLNIGDPNLFDFEPPRFMIEETYQAMLKNKNGMPLRQASRRQLNQLNVKQKEKELQMFTIFLLPQVHQNQ